jgi:hypothetical protein
MRRDESWIVRPDSLHVKAGRALLELDLDGFSRPEVIDQRGGSVEHKVA